MDGETVSADASQQRLHDAVIVAFSTFAILALELALIRWMSQQVRMFAYMNNVLLIAAFLGMGLGLGIGRRRPQLVHATLPLLAILSALLAFSEELGLMRLSLPDPTIYTWGQDSQNTAFALTILKLLALLALVIAIFVCAAALLGHTFGRFDDRLAAYSWDLIGSLAGIVAMTVLAALNTTPPVWLTAGMLPLLWLSPRKITVAAFFAVIVLASFSVRGARFSPYNRLDLIEHEGHPLKPLLLAANRDAHQYLFDLRPAAVNSPALSPGQRRLAREIEYLYELPFKLSPRKGSALIVGAGTGNDVAAALRSGFKRVVAVEIDPVIHRAGTITHPEHPYADPRVVTVISDARTFFERYADEKFDVVCFGLLDSHAMFSAMSSLRLDNYVYTEEAMRSAYGHVADGGVLTVSFSIAGGQWISDRISRLLLQATGVTPVVVDFHDSFVSRTWLVGKGLDVAAAAPRIPSALPPQSLAAGPRVPTDDWPFLYIRPSTFPYGLLTVLLCLLVIATVGARITYGETFFSWRRFNGAFFLLGAAFLLIETRGVTNLSLLFGSTWIVNSAVFAGILLAALAANFVVRRFEIERVTPLFAGLAVALLINYFVAPGFFLRFSPGVGGVLAAIVNGIPVGFAGVIFSWLLKRAADPAAALGWNLLGAVFGGCLEYFSMAFGLRALILIALGLYVLTYLATRASGREPFPQS